MIPIISRTGGREDKHKSNSKNISIIGGGISASACPYLSKLHATQPKHKHKHKHKHIQLTVTDEKKKVSQAGQPLIHVDVYMHV